MHALREVAAMLTAPRTSASEISTYVTMLGGVFVVAKLLGVNPGRVRSWQQGEPPPHGVMFFLDEAYCAAADAPSVDDFEVPTTLR